MARLTRKILMIVAGSLVIALIGASSVILLLLPRIVKHGIVATLQDRFDSEIQIDDLQVGVFPTIHANGHRIVLRMNGRRDAPPLIAIQDFELSASILNLLRGHVSSIHLQGLQIHVPPSQTETLPSARPVASKKIHFSLVVDQIVSEDALLETLPRDAKHVPRDFNIHYVVLHSFSFETPSAFHATLTNPQPLGEIESDGYFGPWRAEQPGDTEVSGTFRYSHADFSSIHGLSGIMSANGKYNGTLDAINVDGDTEMPDFALGIAGNPMPLTTHYSAVVDGTDGNTYLKSVEARLGNSPISVNGEIVGIPGIHGRHIVLDATSHGARAQDLLHLVVKGETPLKGSINLHTKIDLPPTSTDEDVLERLSLNGRFGIGNARFTSPDVQSKLDSLSRSGQGQPKNEDIQNVISNLNGKFVVRKGVAMLSDIRFDVPGAGVRIRGSYNMKSGDLNFRGHLNIDAKLSQATTGAKSLVLKLADPFFKNKGAGSSIPIKITGNRTKPNFGLDLGGKRDIASGEAH